MKNRKYAIDKILSVSGIARTLYIAYLDAEDMGVKYCLTVHFVDGEEVAKVVTPFNGDADQFAERHFVRSHGRDLTGHPSLWPKPLIREIVRYPGLSASIITQSRE